VTDSEILLERFLTIPILRNPLLTRDRQRLAWAWFQVCPTAQVFFAETRDPGSPVQLTDGEENVLPVSWTADGEGLVVRQDRGGDERARLMLLRPRQETRPRIVSPEDPNFYIRGGEIHPSGRWLVYGANVDPSTGEEIEPTWILRRDLETGEVLVLARPRKPAQVQPRLSPDGRYVLYVRSDRHPSGEQVWLVDVEGTEDREILNFGASRKVSARWMPDSRRILFVAEGEGYRRVGLLDLRDGSQRWLLDDPGRNPEDAYVPHGSPWVVVLDVWEGRSRPLLVDPADGRILEPQTPEGEIRLLGIAPAGSGAAGKVPSDEDLGRRPWIAEFTSARHPADLVLIPSLDAPVETYRSLTGMWDRTELRPERLAPAEPVEWRSTDGLRIHGWLHRATGRPKGTLVLVHGGPTARAEDRFHPLVQFLVARGFHVFTPNYRGSTGYGLAFQEAIKENGWGGREQEDIRTGIEELIRRGVAEAGRVGILGTSYGGYSTWVALTRWPREIVAAGAPICGMTDLVLDYETTRPDLRTYSQEMMGGSPEEVPERYRERSPIHFVDRIRVPVLVVQGLRDPNVSPENMWVIKRALEEKGVAHEILTFEDEGHGITRPSNLRILWHRLAEFFEQALGS
jgi:dipeptidyl aminopeptidase/acylaminoacyl peptidase